MRIARRILRIGLVVIVVLVVALTAIVGAITVRGLPQTDGTLSVAGLDAKVSVIRDAAGIVQIFADSPHDLFLAQGYVHAQERLWQMEVWRHISAGRLSELFGKSTLKEDEFIRTLGWRQSAERDLAALSKGAREAVDAYTEGVNAFLDSHRGSVGLAFVVAGIQNGKGGLGGYTIEPWKPVDTLAWQKVQSWQLGGNFESEVFRLLADAKLGDPARTDQLFPAYRADMPVITPSGLPGSGGAGASISGTQAAATDEVAAKPLSLTTDQAAGLGDVARLSEQILKLASLDSGEGLAGDHQVGSNNWVVAPSKSETGGALLANDPHLGIGMPSVWFINGLHCRTVSETCPFDVAGVSFPGIPGIVLGHNAHVAWGATNVDPDVEDLFAEQADPANPDNYLFAGDSRAFTVRTETIKVAGGKNVTLNVRSTGHGPILNDVDPRLKDAPLLALRWTATAAVDGTFESIFRLNTVANFDEFRAAFEPYGSPSQNFVYADVDGHIGYVLPGHIPIRADPADRGQRVRSGSDGKHEWEGLIPTEELPWQLDPPSGIIVSANNAAVDDKYPYFVASEWDPGYRAKRITDLLTKAIRQDGGVLTDTFREIQMDVAVPRAELVRPHLDDAQPATADGQAVLDAIRRWDGNAALDSVGATAYLAFEYRLMRGLFDDELGDLAREYIGGGASWQATIAMVDDPAATWWDDTTTADHKETREEVIAAALDKAGSELRAGYGEPKDWTWGRVHQATFREQSLGTSGIGPLEWYFNKGPYPVAGAAGAIDNNYYRPSRAYPDPNDPSYQPVGFTGVFEVTNLPSYRFTIDMSELDLARIVQTTGQSGNPLDSHYGDLIDDWASGETVPLYFSAQIIDAEKAHRLDLIPPP